MPQQVLLGLIAIFIGLALGAVLFVPFVALSYRRRGGLSLTRLLLWAAALVYFWAIWTYTLLPLPEPSEIFCVEPILDPMSVVRDLQAAFAAPGSPLRQPELLQLLFNVLLFIPLGFFVRVLGNRGVPTALLVGFGISLLVELTQLTGVWGLYPCSYRFFDVGDLMTNSSGAVLGSLLGLIVPRRHRGVEEAADAELPRLVTRGRRALAMLCDGLGFWFVSVALSLTVQLALLYLAGDREAFVDGELSGFVGTAGAAGLWLLVTLGTGRSIGDLAVQLRYAGARIPQPFARALRWAGGVAGIEALGLFGGPFEAFSGLLYPVAIGMLFFTEQGRGLPGLLSGQVLRDAREPLGAGASAERSEGR